MVLSDRHIREQLESGGIVIEPLGEGCIQPSSVDLHVDRLFRVFRNDTTPFIDPKAAQEDLTELVEVEDGSAFILHPGEFVLGSTLERVALGNDLVARLEGKSSLGRLGLLIHSSLPASEEVMFLREGRLEARPIAEIVGEQLSGSVVSFDPDTFEVGYHEVTGWYEGPPDRIYEVRLASGRRVRVTAGHNFFSLDPAGKLAKLRTGELRAGARVAIPRLIPDLDQSNPTIRISDLIPVDERHRITCSGPGDVRLAVRGSTHSLPQTLSVDEDFAWMLGMYVAEGSRRDQQFTISNTNQSYLDRLERILTRVGLPVYRSDHAVTGCCSLFSMLLSSMGTGAGAHTKRIPPMVFSWDRDLLEAFLTGLVDGDGSWEETRVSLWTCSDGLAADVLLLAERLGRRAGSTVRTRGESKLWQIYMPLNEHKLLTSTPLPDRLLVELGELSGLDQAAASRLVGYRHPTDLCNLERRSGREAVRISTLQRLRRAYARRPECSPAIDRLNRLVDGDLLWDRVVEVVDTGSVEKIYDIEVRPGGRKIENFLAGSGGVFVSNTAGFVDAGWDGHLTLELSNVANLPIAIYPGMKIGQISFLQMSSEAENPYGGDATASKYKGQQGPTPSRYYLNFPEDERN